ncbi:MAG: GTPase HflX [Elusimicrobia bacterium CG1_02_63_36]|nr:MAG: GTPase HflX [Elusimicrobia bacterium CG1_02_63_36]PIP84581.1 MAG: GTPase HflX [Elusimicrobia bacterium CG22_combo_CG10-13_8_21_14_all_63_91]PJA17711.1 MAG: GTPase HflX [Elusimicrobia bacterium CG_4_10_14_0_2_um_filter_63_34]PJB25888.1 MAG: GTPase HflX [Elusimicrobia bacterium CG_4_9_14_3_um_filter_62_55]
MSGVEREAALLIGVYPRGRELALESASFEELERLADTAGARVVGSVTQRVERLNPRSLMGKGKVEEAAAAAKRLGAKTVIVNEDLSPAQQLHLEKTLDAKVVDRTRLILDIFAQRAHTKEGELQVELAQLSYMLPRLTGSWRAFSQQVGGIGTRGPGERKIEYERRHIQRRIDHLKRGIEKLEQEREVRRRKRSRVPVPGVAIIGYTNAGKSTLLNRLARLAGKADKQVYADDLLFATLDSTSRRIPLPDGGWAVFTDTVGFISKLPTSLIAAFKSTLEEVTHADCLLHLEDALAPHAEQQRRTVEAVLRELEADRIPRVRAVNKADLLGESERLALRANDPDRLLVSAKSGEGIEDALRAAQNILNDRWLLRELRLAHERSGLLDEVYRVSQVLSQKADDAGILLTLRITGENWARLRKRGGIC